jgi:hypothetical protein
MSAKLMGADFLFLILVRKYSKKIKFLCPEGMLVKKVLKVTTRPLLAWAMDMFRILRCCPGADPFRKKLKTLRSSVNETLFLGPYDT